MTSVQSASRKPLTHQSVSSISSPFLSIDLSSLQGRGLGRGRKTSNYGMHLKYTETNGTPLPVLSKDGLVSSSSRLMEDLFSLMVHSAIHCRNRLQSLQRTRAAAEEDVASPPNGLHNLPSPLLSSSAPSPPSFSSPLTPSLLLPLDEPIQGNPSAAPVYDGEPDCQLFQAIPPQVSQEETFRISPQALQHGPYITVPTPTNDTARCWQESIPLSGLWKERPAQSPMSGESIQFYLPLQTSSTGQMDSTSLSNNSVSHPPTLFTMTCPVPHCCYQCQTVAEIWRHITWTHVRPQPDSGIEGIVERVVLGNA